MSLKSVIYITVSTGIVWLYCISKSDAVITDNVRLKPEELYHIKSPFYPDLEQLKDEYVFHVKTENQDKLRVECDDIRFTSADNQGEACKTSVTFVDGLKSISKCNTEYNFDLTTNGSELVVRLTGGAIWCTVRTVSGSKPLTVHLTPLDGPYLVKTPEEPSSFFDRTWIISSPDGTKLSLQCKIGFPKYSPCYRDVLSVDTGEGMEAYCGGKNLTLFSKGNRVKIRLGLSKYGNREGRCKVQAVTGPNPEQHLNLKSEEIDSSEHGSSPGSKSTTCDCGRANRAKTRILKGTETNEGEYPWMVGIRNRDGHQKCGASIITRRHVLTAAHCVVNPKIRATPDPKSIFIVVAAHNTNRGASNGFTKNYDVIEAYLREEYLSFKYDYDISVLLLDGELIYGQFIGPVCLSSQPLQLLYERIKILGWGQTDKTSGSQVLLKSYMWAVHNNVCNIDESAICAYSSKSATCFGDSGGPLVWLDPETNRYTQVSAVSYGKGDCRGGSVSTNITFHYKWIEETIKRVSTERLCTKFIEK